MESVCIRTAQLTLKNHLDFLFTIVILAFQNLTKGYKMDKIRFLLACSKKKKHLQKSSNSKYLMREKKRNCSSVKHPLFRITQLPACLFLLCPTCHRRQKEVFSCTSLTLNLFWYSCSCQALLHIYTPDLATKVCTNSLNLPNVMAMHIAFQFSF